MSLWIIPIVSIGGLILGGSVSIFLVSFVNEKLQQRRRTKATEGMTDRQKELYDLFN